jgi:hypothetical protein
MIRRRRSAFVLAALMLYGSNVKEPALHDEANVMHSGSGCALVNS